MSGPLWRLLGIAATGAAALALPGALGATTSPSVQTLQARETGLAGKKRSAILSLYSLDARATAADDRLAALEQRESELRAERATLQVELRLDQVDTHRSQLRLAERIRALYDQGGDSTTLDVLFGAKSLIDAMTQLDNLNHVTSVNDQILGQLQTAKDHELATKAQLTARGATLERAITAATAESQTLASVRASRSDYISQLSTQEALDSSQITRLQLQARAAELKSVKITEAPPAATLGVPVPNMPLTTASGNMLSVDATGYCLTGTTATGIPVGWGVAAVDPSVIPLGTHLTIPGYGEAIAADTGSAIVGDRIDLWFPSCAQASGWGSQSVTIALR